ncbi:hypothetical protein JTE90_000831 [Oedothorax gibbosus]|uniref:sn-1-specific diacylglycerol lipase ABHD11 n=1 Tax=Oedothorax gibbosus TaxID=931172 RepID=A0AAV6VW91_9ARAC|nr:hypothetical protein JTE90_000831 [Oedothorax gibbosus]
MVKNRDSRCLSSSVSNSSSSTVTLSCDVFAPEKTVSPVPVIILHGLLGSKKNWRGLGKAISEKNQRKVYALDARNHGDCPHSDKFDYPLMAEDVKNFMTSQSIPEAVVIGHSMGGRTAMLLALTNEPLVNKLIVVDVSPSKMPSQLQFIPGYMREMKKAIAAVSATGLSQGRRAIDKHLSQTIPEASIRQFLLTNLTEKNKMLSWKPNIDVLLEKFDASINMFPAVEGHYSGDTLFICGGDSPYVKTEDHPFIQTLFPKSEFIKIPNAGHWVHSEKPSEFLQAVYDFL